MLYVSTKINMNCYSVMLCVSVYIRGFRQAQAQAYAITEINREPSLLPNVTLGYILYDHCYTAEVEFRGAMSLVSGGEEHFQLHKSCVGSPPVIGIVGPGTSSSSIAISRISGLYRVPTVSFLLECPVIWLFMNVKSLL